MARFSLLKGARWVGSRICLVCLLDDSRHAQLGGNGIHHLITLGIPHKELEKVAEEKGVLEYLLRKFPLGTSESSFWPVLHRKIFFLIFSTEYQAWEQRVIATFDQISRWFLCSGMLQVNHIIQDFFHDVKYSTCLLLNETQLSTFHIILTDIAPWGNYWCGLALYK